MFFFKIADTVIVNSIDFKKFEEILKYKFSSYL